METSAEVYHKKTSSPEEILKRAKAHPEFWKETVSINPKKGLTWLQGLSLRRREILRRLAD